MRKSKLFKKQITKNSENRIIKKLLNYSSIDIPCKLKCLWKKAGKCSHHDKFSNPLGAKLLKFYNLDAKISKGRGEFPDVKTSNNKFEIKMIAKTNMLNFKSKSHDLKTITWDERYFHQYILVIDRINPRWRLLKPIYLDKHGRSNYRAEVITILSWRSQLYETVNPYHD